MPQIKVTGGGTYRLASSISSAQTTIRLSSFKEPVSGTLYTMTYLNSSIEYGTLDPQTDNSEFISFTGITQNADGTATLTGVTRGLSRSDPYTESTDFKTTHAGQSIFILANTPSMYNQIPFKGNDEVISGFWTGQDPLAAQGFATKAYVDALVNGGAVSQNSVVISGNAGETISASGKLIYLNTSNGRWYNASSAASATCEFVVLGISQGAGTTGNQITGGIMVKGVDTHQSGLSAGTIYYISTAGGIASSAGTFGKAIGQAISTTQIYFDPFFFYTPTANQKAAMAGNSGTPSATNRFLDEDYIANSFYTAATDQVQSTKNSSVTIGESNATTAKHYLIAQKFIPAKGNIAGVSLWKAADSGSFTGTVKVSLQADTAGSPSGSDLASYTITNAVWLKLTAAAEITVSFTSEYESLTIGGTYWIVVTPSTSDNTNHPNLGINTAGGYASGLLRFFNNIDGWTTIITSMLYFKTLQGVNSKVVETDTGGLIPLSVRPSTLIDIDATTGSVVDTATETTLYSKLLQGGLFGANSGMRIRMLANFTVATNTTARSLTINFKYNGTVLVTNVISIQNASGSPTSKDALYDFIVLNDNSVSSQKIFGTAVQTVVAINTPASANIPGTISTTVPTISSSADLSQPGLFEVTFKIDATTGGSTLTGTYKGISFEKISK